MRRRNGSEGFTLIELLVVVAIIAVLIAILLPSLTKARGMAKNLICTNNLRSINLGLQMYADEYTDWIPHYMPISSTNNTVAAGWDRYISKYLQLPTSNVVNGIARSWLWYSGNSPFACSELQSGITYSFELNCSYIENYNLGNGNYVYGLHKLSQEKYPEWTLRLGDTGISNWIINTGLIYDATNSLMATRHMGGGNYLFGDGHIEWVKAKYPTWFWNYGKHRIYCGE